MSSRSASSSIVVLNAGTATLKAAAFAVSSGEILEVHRADREWSEGTDAFALVRDALGEVEGPIAAIGHRVVHGGDAFTATVEIDETVEETLEDLLPLAPLHN